MQMTDSFFVDSTVKKKMFFSVLASRYGAVLIPSAPGALYDLAQDNELAKLLNTFVQEKSECMQLLVLLVTSISRLMQGIQDSLGFRIPHNGFRILYQWNLDSGYFQSLVGFCLYSLSCNADSLLSTMFAFFYYLEPICAVGHGVAGLCSARREDRRSWSFKSYSLTGVTF